MKKWLLGLLILLPAVIVLNYFFVPEPGNILSQAYAGCSPGSALRVSKMQVVRQKWMPAAARQISGTKYELDGCTYIFPSENPFDNNIIIVYKNITITSLLTVQPVKDSALINWAFKWPDKTNLFSKLPAYLKASHIKKVNEKILAGLVDFVSDKKNVYGINFYNTAQTDSTLISIKPAPLNHRPTTVEIYNYIDKLSKYALENGAAITRPPMLNITYTGDSTWIFMVALAVNKELPDHQEILSKRMFAGGKILESDPITGGTGTVDHFINELENFRFDYSYISPAIPFQSLITDRRNEPDSSKWVTRLYYPVY